MTNDKTQPMERWSNDQFLNGLRQQGDQLADECFHKLKEESKGLDFSDVFKALDTNEAPLPNDAPQPLSQFFEQTAKLPSLDDKTIDLERIERGQKVFMTHAFPSAMVLLTKSLPEGYAAPNLSKVLRLSDNLSKRPYRRLLGVLQMLVNVSAVGGFEAGGKAIITIPKIRLLHAGVRHIVRKHLSDYENDYGVPVNLEDMLGTVMGFSYLIITGLQKLGVGLTDEEAEDFYYLWRVIAQMMGIHPTNEPNNSMYVPANLAEASVFYDSYRRRHFVAAVDNPDGVQLAKANLKMLSDLLPQTPLRRLGLNIVPRIFMEDLMGKEGCALVGVKPVRFLYITKWFLKSLPPIWTWLWGVGDILDPSGHLHENLSRIFFQSLINREFNGEITFLIPDTLDELRRLSAREGRWEALLDESGHCRRPRERW